MVKKRTIGSPHKSSKLIFNSPIINPSPRIHCLVCDKFYATNAGYARHAEKHVKNGELVKFIKNPKADLHLQRYGYRLPVDDCRE